MNLVSEEDLFLNLPEERRSDYKLLAGDLLSNKLFKDLMIEMRRTASVKMFYKSEVIDDILFGKAMLYTIDIMQKKIKSIESGNFEIIREL